jgi:hypothetical protein
LFTLVGIAGEDDLDAPDLGAGGNADKIPGFDIQPLPKPASDERPFAESAAGRKDKVIRSPRIVLSTDQSEALRDRLVAELSDLKSADEAADWVQNNLPAKNTLTPADAESLEASFRERLTTIEGGRPGAGTPVLVDNSSVEHLQDQSRALAPETPASVATIVRPRPSRPRPSVCATRSTAGSSPGNPASSAAARQPRRIIFASSRPER